MQFKINLKLVNSMGVTRKMEDNHLKKGLSSRQVQMIALGGTVGVESVYGSSSTILWTGPWQYCIFSSRAILIFSHESYGRMVYLYPTTGSFANYASDYLHPVAGYVTAG